MTESTAAIIDRLLESERAADVTINNLLIRVKQSTAEVERLRALLLEIFSAALKLHSKKIGLPYFLKIEEEQLDRIRATLGEE